MTITGKGKEARKKGKTSQKSESGNRHRLKQASRRIANALMPSLYFECPCCGELAKSFLPHGAAKQRENARCPGCGCVERHRLQWLFLRDETNLLKEPLKVLHFAPEVALQKRLQSAPNVTYHSADLEAPRAAEHFDICAIPYPDDTFDVILCSHVLEHVPDDRKAMSELFRVMKPGGWGLIEVPYTYKLKVTLEDPTITTDEERTRAYGQANHLRRYGRDFHDRLRAAGFEVERHLHSRKVKPKLIGKYRLPKDGAISISRKPRT